MPRIDVVDETGPEEVGDRPVVVDALESIQYPTEGTGVTGESPPITASQSAADQSEDNDQAGGDDSGSRQGEAPGILSSLESGIVPPALLTGLVRALQAVSFKVSDDVRSALLSGIIPPDLCVGLGQRRARRKAIAFRKAFVSAIIMPAFSEDGASWSQLRQECFLNILEQYIIPPALLECGLGPCQPAQGSNTDIRGVAVSDAIALALAKGVGECILRSASIQAHFGPSGYLWVLRNIYLPSFEEVAEVCCGEEVLYHLHFQSSSRGDRMSCGDVLKRAGPLCDCGLGEDGSPKRGGKSDEESLRELLRLGDIYALKQLSSGVACTARRDAVADRRREALKRYSKRLFGENPKPFSPYLMFGSGILFLTAFVDLDDAVDDYASQSLSGSVGSFLQHLGGVGGSIQEVRGKREKQILQWKTAAASQAVVIPPLKVALVTSVGVYLVCCYWAVVLDGGAVMPAVGLLQNGSPVQWLFLLVAVFSVSQIIGSYIISCRMYRKLMKASDFLRDKGVMYERVLALRTLKALNPGMFYAWCRAGIQQQTRSQYSEHAGPLYWEALHISTATMFLGKCRLFWGGKRLNNVVDAGSNDGQMGDYYTQTVPIEYSNFLNGGNGCSFLNLCERVYLGDHGALALIVLLAKEIYDAKTKDRDVGSCFGNCMTGVLAVMPRVCLMAGLSYGTYLLFLMGAFWTAAVCGVVTCMAGCKTFTDIFSSVIEEESLSSVRAKAINPLVDNMMQYGVFSHLEERMVAP